MGLNIDLTKVYNLKEPKIKCKKCGNNIHFDIHDYDFEDWLVGGKKIFGGDCRECEIYYEVELVIKASLKFTGVEEKG